MTKEQLSNLSDIVRLPLEVLLSQLPETKLHLKTAAVSTDGGVALFFEAEKAGLLMTADIEIHEDGAVSASVIPYVEQSDGHHIFESESEPIDLWEVEEAPPFEETLNRIQIRLGIIPA